MRVVVLLTVVFLVVEAQAAPLLSPAAGAHLARATRYYEQGEYQLAIDECLRGQAIEMSADFSYLLGQAERRRGNCRVAIGYYQSALALARSDRQAGFIRLQLERCRQELQIIRPASRATSSAPASQALGPTVGLVSRPPPRPPAPRWYRDWPGGLLAGIGLVALGVGAGLLGSSYATVHDSEVDTHHYLEARGAEGRYQAGTVLLGVGVVSLVSGVARYIAVARRVPER